MDIKDFIQAELDRVKQACMKTLDGLTHHEFTWRPGPEANSIGVIVFHAVRSEDTWIQSRIQGKPQVWEAEKWYEKLGLPPGEIGSGYNAEQLAAFKVPELKVLSEYAEVVRNRTLEYLQGATAAEFDRTITVRSGEIKIGAYLAQLLVHLAQHSGEIAYLRGVQRGMNK